MIAYTVKVFHYFDIPKSHHLPSAFTQLFSATGIMFQVCRLGMRRAINFYNQFVFWTGKIRNVAADG